MKFLSNCDEFLISPSLISHLSVTEKLQSSDEIMLCRLGRKIGKLINISCVDE